ERHRGHEQREPAQLHREQELPDELAPVRVRRTDGRDDRLARQDHHVPDLFENALGRQERSIRDCSDQCFCILPGSELPRPRRAARPSLRHRPLKGKTATVSDRTRKWYVATALSGWRRTSTAIVAGLVTVVTLSSCGGGARQDATGPTGTFNVDVTSS